MLLFAAIFSTISVIEDRNQGFLQGVLAAPVGRGAIVAGKVLGGATLAWLQAMPFLALAPLAGIALTLRSAAAVALVLAVLAVALTAIGFGFAWRVDSVQGFHAVMNLLLVPMWLLSGAFFPLAGAPVWLRALMRINPMTYGVEALRGALYGGGGPGADQAAGQVAGQAAGMPGPLAVLGITALLAVAGFAFALAATRGARID